MAESNKANNTASSSLTIAGGTPPVDLAINSRSRLPASAQTGTTPQVQWTVVNNGTTATTASSWTDTVYLSADTTLDGSDTSLGSFSHAGALAAGASYTNSQLVTIPQALTAGNYYLIIVTDSGNQVTEPGAENNNTAVSPAVAVTRSPVPDLAVTNVTAPASGNVGSPVTIGWTVSNSGGTGAFSNWVDRVYLSTDGTLTGAVSLGDFTRPSTLAAGASYTQSVSAVLPVTADGAYFIVVVTNATGSVYEQGATANNQATSGALAIRHPDLVAQNVVVPASAQSGAPLTVTWRVTNSGSGAAGGSWVDNVYLSADNTLDGSDVLLGSVNAPSALAAGASYNSTLTATVPNGTNGTYYIFVVADAAVAVNEGPGNRVNNTALSAALPITLAPYADLTVTAVSASSNTVIGNPASLTVSWTVQNNGTGPGSTSNWSDLLVLSRDGTLGNGDDIVIGTVAHTGALPVGVSYSGTQIVALPANLQGSFTLFVKTDSAGAVYQGPNTSPDFLAASSPVAVALRPYADLVVQNVVGPATANNNQSVSLSWTVTNQGVGTTDSANWSDIVYFSTDPTGATGLQQIGNFDRAGLLNVGESYSRTVNVNVPLTANGPGYFFVQTGGPYEFIYTNNNTGRSGAVAVNYIPPPRTDLEVISVNAPTTALDGQSINVTWTVRTNGPDPVANSWVDTVYLAPNGNLAQATALGTFTIDPPLDPGHPTRVRWPSICRPRSKASTRSS